MRGTASVRPVPGVHAVDALETEYNAIPAVTDIAGTGRIRVGTRPDFISLEAKPVFTVIHGMKLTVPVDSIVETVDREFLPVFDGLEGFRGFRLVKTAPDVATILVDWETGADAAKGMGVIGQTLFRTHLMPILAADMPRSMGEEVLRHIPGA